MIRENRQEGKARCCTYLKQTILIMMVLGFFVALYSLDETVLAIGSLRNNITETNNRDLAATPCDSVCAVPYLQPLSESQCCLDSATPSTCMSKHECNLEVLTRYQNDLNDQYLLLILEVGIELLIVLFIAVYCVKKRMERAKRQREGLDQPVNTENNHAAIFNVVGSLRIRRQYEPPSLESSFLYGGENNCAICLESLLEAKAIKLRCHHIFHSQCIKEWMDTKDSCPICRTKK